MHARSNESVSDGREFEPDVHFCSEQSFQPEYRYDVTTENIAQCPLCRGLGTINRAMVCPRCDGDGILDAKVIAAEYLGRQQRARIGDSVASDKFGE